MITLVEKMATRNGFGWILGEGSYFETTMLGYWSPEKDVDAFAVEGKAKMTIHYQNYCARAYDSLGFCYFFLMDTTEQDIVDLLESAAGLSANDDTLPKRFLKEPMPEGPSGQRSGF